MSRVWEAVRDGRPIDFTPYVDVHGHFGNWRDAYIPGARDGAGLVREMDRMGCDMAWISASDPGFTCSMQAKNDVVFDLAERYPDRVIPYCTLSAHEPDGCLAELERCLRRGRCIGVKMHVYEQPPYTLKSAFLRPVLELLAEHRLVYMNHDLGDTEILRWALAAHPEVTFVSGHPDGRANDLAADFPNVRSCTCAASGHAQVAKEVRRLGRSDSMLLGADFGLFNLAFGLGMVAYADLPEQDKLNLIGLNALRILDRVAWFDRSMLRACTAGGPPE